jgi:hypothetical protein
MSMLNRLAFVLLVVFALVICQTTQTVAIQTGAISGVVTDASTSGPVDGAKVSIVAPTGNYTATTNASGFYSFVALPPDTYTVTVSKSGYELGIATGLTITQGVNYKNDVHLIPSVKTLGRVPVKSAHTTLVQKDLTTDAYDVGVQQQEQLKGAPLSSEQFGLLTQLPGVSSAGGYPILRGGLENNEGYQIEGISVVDPFFNQFSNNDIFNGAQSIKVVLGAGDASQGGAGSGYINEVAKRGTYPAHGLLQGELGLNTLQNNVNFEYGGASPDNRFSWFLSGRYAPYMAQGGSQGANGGGHYSPQQVVGGIKLNDSLGGLKYTNSSDSVINLFYRFGNNNADQLQFYDEYGLQKYGGNYGININQTLYYAYDPQYAFWTGLFAPYQAQLLPDFIRQNPNIPIPNEPQQTQQYDLSKIALSHQFNDTTNLNIRVFRLTGNTEFNLTEPDLVYLGFGFPSLFNEFYEVTPFQTTGTGLDFQKQVGNKNFFTVGGEYKFSNGHLLLGYPGSLSFLFLPNEFGDFIPGNGGLFDVNKIGCCVRMPLPQYGTLDPEYSSSAYLSDSIKPNDRLTVLPGIRWETQRINQPVGVYNVSSWAPKLNASYALGSTEQTVLRASYGHSTVFAPLGQVETIYQAPASFKNNPSTLSTCGFFTAPNGPFTAPCQSYYDQIVNDLAANIGINPAAFPKPQQSDSYDFSIEQAFPYQISAKLTTWYRRDYDVIVNEAVPITVQGSQVNGPQTVVNNGYGHGFGVDLGILRQLNQGLSGQLNLTYINQFINYLSANAFIPTVSPATLATVVHPPYLSPFQAALALDYRRSGWRISPDLIYSKGTPQGFAGNTYVKINGVYQAVPNTNYYGNANPCYFVDPQVPGSASAPNIVGSVGGGCPKARYTNLSKANIFGNFTISKDVSHYSTAGISIYNLFNNQVVGLYNNLSGGNFSYVNNGFGASGLGSGFSQYGPQGSNVVGAPSVLPPGPYFNTTTGSAISGIFFVNVKI